MQGFAGRSWLWSLGLGVLCAGACSFDSTPIQPVNSGTVSPPATGSGSTGHGGTKADDPFAAGVGGQNSTAGNDGSAGRGPAGNGGRAGTAGTAGTGTGGTAAAGSGGTSAGGISAGSGGTDAGGTGGTDAGGTGGTPAAGTGGTLTGCANPLFEGLLCDDGLFCTVGEHCHNGACGGGALTKCANMADSCNTVQCDEAAHACTRVPARENMDCSDNLFCTTSDLCHNGACVGGPARDCAEIALAPCHVGQCDEDTDSCTQVPGLQGTSCDDGIDCTSDAVCNNGVCSASVCKTTCAPSFDCNVTDCHNTERCELTCEMSGGCALNCSGSAQCGLSCRGTSCGLTCTGVSQCKATCEAGATCNIDCRGAAANACDAIVCDNSQCTLTCNGSSSCGFKDCNTEAQCADGTVVCGRACPALPP